MLDVGAADAFLIHAFVDFNGIEYEYVVLVDAGNEGDGGKILNHINNYYAQKYIDLAICTHCDSDHYGGFKELIAEHNKPGAFHIDKIWIHDPYKHVNVDDVKYIRNEQSLRKRLNGAYAFSDGSSLLELIDRANIKRGEPFRGACFTPINLYVLGPDQDYYESLIPDFRVDLDFKEEQQDDSYSGLYTYIYSEKEFLSKALDDAKDDPSKVNQSSVIFYFGDDNGKMLFTGDAGREALLRVIHMDTEGSLSNVSWMNVPHHGSKHNLNSTIINYFHPSISYMSTEKYGKYANICTVNALKNVGDVYSTHKDRQSLWYHHNMNGRANYSPVEPL